jgi:hypothetical protein
MAANKYRHKLRSYPKGRVPHLHCGRGLKTFRRSISCCNGGRDSSVGIATRYGLDGPGIESRLRRDFPHLFIRDPEAHPASYTMGTGSLPRVKRQKRGLDHPTHLAPRLNKE